MNQEPHQLLGKSWKSRWAVLAALALAGGTPLAVLVIETQFGGLHATPGEWKGLAAVVGLLVAGGLVYFAGAALVRWFACWRNLRRVLLTFASLATMVLVFYAVEDWRGWHAWHRYVGERTARGEKFGLAFVMPAPVPDEQNFCQCPLLKPALDWRKVDGVVVWRDTNGWARVQALRPWLAGSAYPSITNGLLGWQAYYRSLTSTNIEDTAQVAFRRRYGLEASEPPAFNLSGLHLTNSPAQDVLLVLQRFEGDLAELKREAARRPLDRWAIFYDTNSPLGILLPHLANVKGICMLLQVRELAEIAAGDTAAAVSDLQLGCRLAESVRAEPFIISHLVRFVCWELLLPPFQEGLRRHGLTDAQLADLQRQLLPTDLLAGYQLGVAGELAGSSAWTSLTRKQCDDFSTGVNPEIARLFYAIARFGTYAPRGWVYQNQLVLCHLSEDYLASCVDIARRTVPPERTRALATGFKQAKGPYSVLASLVFDIQARFGDLYFRCERLAHAQTQIDQTIIACGLERYRLAHGEYPDDLAALVPAFLGQVPHDLINGQPLHYQRRADGDYRLYSVGWNETDEGGTTVRKDDGEVDLRQGDWVW